MQEKLQPSTVPTCRRRGSVGALLVAVATIFGTASLAVASNPELNPQRGGSDIDLNALAAGRDDTQAPVDAVRVVQQAPHLPQEPQPEDPVLRTVPGYDATRIYDLCVQDPDRTDINCIDPPPGGFDHAAAGTGLRNTGIGAIQLRGVPEGAVAMAAWLYWGQIASSEDSPQDLATAYFDGIQLDGTEIATAAEPCWNPTGGAQFYVHRTSVLRLLRPGVNGIYSVQTLLSSITTGTDPWLDTGNPPWAEGATLVVVYSHEDTPSDSRVYLSHGAGFLRDGLEVDHDLSPPLPDGVCGFRHTRAGGDGQSSWEEQALVPINTSIGEEDALVIVRGPASNINPDADWQGSDGGPKNQLWDTQTSELAGGQLDMLESGDATYRVLYEPHTAGGPFKDCVVVAVHVLTAFAEPPLE